MSNDKFILKIQQQMSGLEDAVDMLKLLANPKRLAILCSLGEREHSVNEIAEGLDMGQSAVSQHLNKLKQAELVRYRRDHNKIYYSLCSKEVESIIALLKKLYCH